MYKPFMYRLWAYCLALSLFVSHAHAQNSQKYYQTASIKGLEAPAKAYDFLVIGDWGRGGHFGQKDLADDLDKASYILEARCILSTGDNFYENGVASVNDPQWQTSFENIYSGGALFRPWYPVLGNHDYRGNAQAQIDYSKVSQRWNMPSRYHSFERTLEDGSGEKVLFVFMDTPPYDKAYYKNPLYQHSDLLQQDTAKQMIWLKETLQKSTARWKIVLGHHPLYTSGKRAGATKEIIETFERTFEEYKVDAYFSGHEHSLQHSKPSNVYTHHFISGAGSEAQEVNAQPYTKFNASTTGFMAVSILKNSLLVQVIDAKGKVIYKTAIEKN